MYNRTHSVWRQSHTVGIMLGSCERFEEYHAYKVGDGTLEDCIGFVNFRKNNYGGDQNYYVMDNATGEIVYE